MEFRISRQENMTLEEVARDRPQIVGAPGTGFFQKILRQEYLVNEVE